MHFAVGARGLPAVARTTREPRYEDLKNSFTKGKLNEANESTRLSYKAQVRGYCQGKIPPSWEWRPHGSHIIKLL